MFKFALFLALSLSSAAGAATLIYAAGGEPVSLESGNISDTNSVIVQNQIYDTLTKVRPGTTILVPGLATKWQPNADRSAWTFTLRQNVKFHDGTPFNADAVIFNVNRWWDASTPGAGRPQKIWESWNLIFGDNKGPGSVLKTVRKDSDYQVTFVLSRPLTNFPDMIGANFFGIASPAAVKKAGDKYGTPSAVAVGTGPFMFDNWKTGSQLNLKANPSYWGEKPKVSALQFRFIKDPSARLTELKSGTADMACDLNPDSLSELKSNKALTAVLRPSFNVGFLSLNTQTPALKNPKVRQAIKLAINRAAIAQGFWGELGVTDNSFLPPALAWANSKKVGPAKQDVAAAQKLLAESGVKNISLDLWYMPVSRPYFPTPKPIAEAMAADLSAIGIKVNLKTEDWAKYLADRNEAPGFDMYMLGWSGQYGAASNFYDAYYSEKNVRDIGYNNAQVQKLLAQAASATGKPQQAALYAQVQELTDAAAVRIPIIHSRPICAMRSAITGWVPNPSNSEQFTRIDKK